MKWCMLYYMVFNADILKILTINYNKMFTIFIITTEFY